MSIESMGADAFREEALADEALQDHRDDWPDWLRGWVVMNYIAQSNLATDSREPLDPVSLRLLEDWSGWTPQDETA